MTERLSNTIEKIRNLDEKIKIIGSFLIQRNLTLYSPRAMPEFVVKGWVGLEVPVRFPIYHEGFANANTVFVTQGDVVASLLAQERDEAADWFENHAIENLDTFNQRTCWFNEEDGIAAIDSPVSTDAYYKYLQSKNR